MTTTAETLALIDQVEGILGQLRAQLSAPMKGDADFLRACDIAAYLWGMPKSELFRKCRGAEAVEMRCAIVWALRQMEPRKSFWAIATLFSHYGVKRDHSWAQYQRQLAERYRAVDQHFLAKSDKLIAQLLGEQAP